MRRLAAVLLALGASSACTRCPGPAPAPDAGPFVRSPERPIKDLVRSEEIAGAVNKAAKAKLIRGLLEQDFARVESILTDDFLGVFDSPAAPEFADERGVRIWDATPPREVLNRAAFIARLRALVGGWPRVERAVWHPFRSFAAEGHPPPFVHQRLHFDLAGRDADGSFVELHAIADVELVHDASGHWAIRRFDLAEPRWSRSSLRRFIDASEVTGFKFHSDAASAELTQAVIDERHLFTSGGIAALDFDRDGHMDLLATFADRETTLFRNDGRGGFIPVKLPLLSKPEQISKVYAWADLDNDGREELVGSRVISQAKGAAGPGPGSSFHGTRAEVPLYTFEGGQMKRRPEALSFEIPAWMRRIDFHSIVPCDVNGDQLLDLIFVGYSHLDSKRHPSFIDATDGMRNLLFINRGGLRFVEEGTSRGLRETRYSLVASCHDFDADGDNDLFVGNDFGNNDYYVNDGQGRYTADRAHPFSQGSSFSMGVSVADFDNTGNYALSLSNMYSHAGNRIVPLTEGFEGVSQNYVLSLASGNTFYERDGETWRERAVARGVDVSGWAWGNNFFDFDNDGDKDLYVVNGNNTHRRPDAPDF